MTEAVNIGLITIVHLMLIIFSCNNLAVFARSWDLAVTMGKEIDFITENGSLTGKTIIAEASTLMGIAYDDDSYTMFLSDAHNNSFSIFSVDLSAKNITIKPLLERERDSHVQSVAFDGITRNLFWTTEHAVMKVHVPLNGPPGRPVLLHKLDEQSPRGIALDVCNRHIYWANGNRTNPSIERSNLDGTNRRLIISDNLYEPVAVAIDHINSQLYWIDDEEGIHYKLERSELDGNRRVVIVHGRHQEPVNLALSRNAIYWTDYVYRAVWRINKNAKPSDLPEQLESDNPELDERQIYPTSLISRDNLGNAINCKVMKAEALARKPTTVMVPQTTPRTFSNLTTSSEMIDQPEKHCFNGGVLESIDSSCRCKPGYSGSRCEISSCHNYCLGGECFINDKGMPVCKCDTAYRGVRCEVTFDMSEICALYCMNRQLQMTSIDTSSCRCAELNQTIEEVLGYDTFNCTILVPLLSVFVGMLTIVVIFLSVYVSRLRRRPRIKKRFVVNKAGVTPLTSRPSQMTADQCEITIENCCNMNICETPCFEPKLCTPNVRSNGVKKEEKSSLLDHMENGGNSC